MAAIVARPFMLALLLVLARLGSMPFRRLPPGRLHSFLFRRYDLLKRPEDYG